VSAGAVLSGARAHRSRTGSVRLMDTVLHDAWAELKNATLRGWYVGLPVYDMHRRRWVLYAFDPTEYTQSGDRSREWTAVADTQEAVVDEMARWLRAVKAGPRLS